MDITRDSGDTLTPIADYFRTAIVVDDRVEDLADDRTAIIADNHEEDLTDELGHDYYPGCASPGRSDPVEGTPIEGMTAPDGGDGEKAVPIASLVRTFLESGLVCSVIEASGKDDPVYSMDLPRHADEHLWILDWMIAGDHSATVDLIKKLTASASGTFLVIVVLTAHDLDEVSHTLTDEFGFTEIEEQPYTFRKADTIVLTIGKPDSKLPDRQMQRILTSYRDFPNMIFSDLEKTLGGIVPTLVFAAVNRIRQQTPRILSSFSRDLDRPFLLHRMLLPEPDEAPAQLLELLAAEFSDILHEHETGQACDSTTVRAHVEETEHLRASCHNVYEFFETAKGRLPSEDRLAPVVDGLAGLRVLNWVGRSSASHRDGERLEGLRESLGVDRRAVMRFAALICARRVGGIPPALEMGIVLRERTTPAAETGESLLLCIQPRCDSVRLRDVTAFPFLPLRELPSDGRSIAARPDSFAVIDGDRYAHVTADRKFRNVTFKDFEPSTTGTVTAAGSQDAWAFEDTDGQVYDVLCTLRGSFTRRALQSLIADIERPAIDEMEWLRRYGRPK